MHKFSRTLLLAGVLAFGTLSAACGDKVTVAGPGGAQGVQLVTVTPPSATIGVGESIILSGQVTADAASAKTVTWTTSNNAIATVDASGKVTGVKAGTASITATSTADNSKAASSVITVSSVGGPVPPQVSISQVNNNGAPANLSNAFGQLDVTLLATGGAGNIELFLSPAANCTSNTIAATDVLVASQTTQSSQSGPITLSFNSAQLLTATGQPRFANGQYCVKSRITTATGTAIATNTIPLTLANVSSYTAKLTFTSKTGGPTSAVSDINGLSYNQGDLSVAITPINFTTASPVALISGSFVRQGVIGSVFVSDVVNFTNVAVTGGVATVTLSDTVGGVINNYTSIPTGTSIVINSATDAAGNSVFTGVAASGIRIDNEAPPQLGGTIITAANGYLAAAYSFASGNTPLTADSVAGVPGVGGVTISYYSGAAGSAAFTTANSCDVTGLTTAATAAGLPNTVLATDFAAKVVIADKLGNKTCRDVSVTTVNGVVTVFGVDKIAPVIGDTLIGGNTPATIAKNQTGYTTGQYFTFTLNDSISGFDISPLIGTIIKDFTAQGSFATNANCIEGKFTLATKTCVAQDTGFQNALLLPTTTGYYTFSAAVQDQAGNLSGVKTSTVAIDPVGPSLGTIAATPNPATPLTAVTLAGSATDDLDLVSTSGWVSYPTVAPGTFQAVAGTAWAAFDPTLTKSATASVTLDATTIFSGLQSTTGGVIQSNAVAPVGNMTVKDVGGTASATSSTTIVTNPTLANVWGGFGFLIQGSNPSARATSTTLTIRVTGPSTDVPFQSQPFKSVQIYRLTGGQLVPAGAANTGAVSSLDASTTPPTRIYTFTMSGVPLGTGAAGSYVYYAVAVTNAGNAVISDPITIVNP